MIYGYARVSSIGQAQDGNSLEYQERELKEHGAEMIYCDSFTGTKATRPELDKLIADIQPGDTFIVTKLDRMTRSVRGGWEIVDTLRKKGAIVNILNMGGVLDDSPMGQAMLSMFMVIAQLERDMMVQRCKEGKTIAKSHGKKTDGRYRKETPDFENFLKKQKDGLMTVKECCELLGISRSVWYARIREVA